MGPTANRIGIVVAALACASAAAISFGALHENPTGRLVASPDPAPPTQQLPEPASSVQATVAPVPTPFVICDDPPADPNLGETTFVDLNNDGQAEAIAPARSVAGIGNLVEYDVLVRDGDCQWNPIGSIRQGSVRSPEHQVVDHFWTCTHGHRTDTGDYVMRLVEVSTPSEPGSQMTVRQLAMNESTLEPRQTAVVTADEFTLRPAPEACKTNRLIGEAAVAVDHCEGADFSLVPPEGWRTTAAGIESCAWFTTGPSTLPCQCDAFPAISVRSWPHAEAAETAGVAETIIDGRRAVVTEQLDLEGMGFTTYNLRSYLVRSEQSTIVIAANSQDWPGTWEELTRELDRFAQAIQIVDPTETVAPVDRFAATADGLHRYAGGDDPLGRLDYGCTIGSQLNPRLGQTLLHYQGTTITPAFRDVARTGDIHNMVITESNFVLWESHSCQSSGLYLGRIDDEGYIVDRHLVAGRGITPLSWTVTDGEELLIVEPEDWSAPTLSTRRVMLAESPGWATTADPAFDIGEPIARSIDDDGNWYLGTRRGGSAALDTCAGPTILRDHPDGLRRVSDYRREIVGEIVDITVSPVVDDWRLAVVLTSCPDQYEGLVVWFAEERRGSSHQSDWLAFAQADLAPVAEVLEARISHDPFTLYATIVMLDGTTTEVTLTRPPPG